MFNFLREYAGMSDQRERQKPRRRRVRLDAERPIRGLGEPQQADPEYLKRYSGSLLARDRGYYVIMSFYYIFRSNKNTRKFMLPGILLYFHVVMLTHVVYNLRQKRQV